LLRRLAVWFLTVGTVSCSFGCVCHQRVRGSVFELIKVRVSILLCFFSEFAYCVLRDVWLGSPESKRDIVNSESLSLHRLIPA